MTPRSYQGVRPAASQVPQSSRPTPRRWASPLLDLVILGAIIVAAYVVAILPAFRLTTIEVQGTQKLNPAYIVEQAHQLLFGRVALLFPQSSYFFASPETLQKKLTAQLHTLLPIESITVVKRFPRSLLITVHEQSPVGVLKVGEKLFTLDAQGTLTDTLSPDEQAPVVEETNQLKFTAGETSLAPAVLAALPIIRDTLTSHALGPVTFQTPPLECPFDLQSVPPEIIRTTPESNANTNDTNTINTNQQGIRLITPTVPLRTDCDLKELLHNDTEIVAVTGDGWTVRLDVAKPVGESLTVLFQALNSTLKNQSLHSVDLRFTPRVIYR